MRRRLGPTSLLCATVALAALALAPGAAAAARGRVLYFAAARGSHGYQIGISNTGHKQISVEVERGDASSAYKVRAHVNRDGIEANLGSFGAIDAHFVPRRRPRARSGRRCRYARVQVGTLRGAIQFTGEDGYTTLVRRQIPALRLLTGLRGCRKRAATRPLDDRPKLALTLLGAKESSGNRELVFAALGLEEVGGRSAEPFSIPGLLVAAELSERAGRVAIQRSAFRLFEEGILVSEPRLSPVRITVGLPPPFSGTADFRQEAGAAPTWVGDLAITFPGAPKVPLTGPGFEVAFCRSASETAFERCGKRFFDDPAQASGSQSQAFWDVSASWSR